MDCNEILENGYDRLAELLPERDKSTLEGYDYALEDLETFKENLDDISAFADMSPALERIGHEIAVRTVERAITWLESARAEMVIAFVDSNHYSIEEDGSIVDDDTGEKVEVPESEIPD